MRWRCAPRQSAWRPAVCPQKGSIENCQLTGRALTKKYSQRQEMALNRRESREGLAPMAFQPF
jgi:hypothetical protein